MSYEMQIRGTIPGEVEAVREAQAYLDGARKTLRELVERRDQAESTDYDRLKNKIYRVERFVDRCVEALRLARTSRFLLNNSGMEFLRNAMAFTGMGVYSDFPPFPEPQTYRLGHDDAEYKADVAQTLVRNEDEKRRIPLHKLSSNDGWLVTPEECLSALNEFTETLARWGIDTNEFRLNSWSDRRVQIIQPWVEEHLGSNGAPFSVPLIDELAENIWLEWLNYLERAAQYGGFEVW